VNSKEEVNSVRYGSSFNTCFGEKDENSKLGSQTDGRFEIAEKRWGGRFSCQAREGDTMKKRRGVEGRRCEGLPGRSVMGEFVDGFGETEERGGFFWTRDRHIAHLSRTGPFSRTPERCQQEYGAIWTARGGKR